MPMLSMPVDLALGFVFPIHGHIGFSSIVSDYVPKPARGAARTALLPKWMVPTPEYCSICYMQAMHRW